MDQAENFLMLSVVMPIYNGSAWLGEALASIYSQSFSNFELILVDDASTDSLSKILDRYRDPRLPVLHLTENVGVAAARNLGVSLAKGKYIAFCDSDDICHPARFERQLDFFHRNPLVGVCGSFFTCFDNRSGEMVRNPTSDREIRRALMFGNCFGMSTMMGRAEILKKNSFNQALNLAEDYDLWTRISSNNIQMANLSESLLHYRIHSQQVSKKKSSILDHASRKIRALYCARLLGQNRLIERIDLESIILEDLEQAADLILNYCAIHPEVAISDFRFMLAWLYQKLPDHGFSELLRWAALRKKLGLNLNSNYILNITLLAFLPRIIESIYFDTLIKLKK